ncbi:synaptophysin-like protein 1 isoform X2 [Pseudophryne corroboree]|uniref:synaptophysin-like protein 1 isoform X2 n=1 Tax=Pseudophryne corroboree TaxID=495146 RepID=UPI0030821A47
MNRLTQKMSGLQLNFSPLKEPLGFIKLLEWIFSIFSFATCGGYSGTTSMIVSCEDKKLAENHTIEATFMYPFRLNEITFSKISGLVCNSSWDDLHLTADFSAPAQFYVTIAVFAFLYCIGALVLYLGFRHLYQDSQKLPLIDFIITILFAFMWLVSSCAWAKALSDIKYLTDPKYTKEGCKSPPFSCAAGTESRMGSLNISVAFGFLNLILWAGNAWFVYKETNLHAPPVASNPEQQGPPPSSM